MVVVRRGRASDLPELMRLEGVCFSEPWGEAALALEISGDPRRLPVVLDEEGRLIGFAFVWIIADELHLVSLAVDPVRRRQGWAQRLLDAVLADPATLGASIVTLEVRASNEAALALYRRNGFEQIAMRKGYYDHGREDAVVMLKTL